MLCRETLREYNRLRKLGWCGSKALAAARINVRFSQLENAGLVRLDLEPEIDCYPFDEILEGGDLSKTQQEKYIKDVEQRINSEGYWILVTSVLEDNHWVSVGSMGGFVGEDWKDSNYDTDVKEQALKAFDRLQQEVADELANRATYAGSYDDCGFGSYC